MLVADPGGHIGQALNKGCLLSFGRSSWISVAGGGGGTRQRVIPIPQVNYFEKCMYIFI